VKTQLWAIGLSIVFLLILGGCVRRNYQTEIAAAREQTLAGSQLVETSLGPVEYGTTGDGPPVLVVHGSGGGYDQGLALAEFLGTGLRFIAPSRFGYLRSPMPEDVSPAAQADHFVALLDELGIESVPVVGISAGGLSALQFALRHPQRCSALVMVSAVSQAPSSASEKPPAPDWVYRTLFQTDLPYWLLTKAAPQTVASLIGVPTEIQQHLDPEEQAWVTRFLETIQPVTLRSQGILNDTSPPVRSDPFAIGGIRVPTLVVHAMDDALVPVSEGEFTAATIPGAQSIIFGDGGHLLLGHHQDIQEHVGAFLQEHSR
jgi:pimeloyl-ACP methyl ester carboxylesterase